MDDFGNPVLKRLLTERADDVTATHADFGDATACVASDRLVDVFAFLRDDPACAFEMLTDLTVVDRLGADPRFEMVYHLYSIANNQRLRVKAGVAETQCEVASLTGLYASADWMEREAFDLYGVRFSGHPDLRRILLYDEFDGHPLRKDYPKERRQPLVGPKN